MILWNALKARLLKNSGGGSRPKLKEPLRYNAQGEIEIDPTWYMRKNLPRNHTEQVNNKVDFNGNIGIYGTSPSNYNYMPKYSRLGYNNNNSVLDAASDLTAQVLVNAAKETSGAVPWHQFQLSVNATRGSRTGTGTTDSNGHYTFADNRITELRAFVPNTSKALISMCVGAKIYRFYQIASDGKLSLYAGASFTFQYNFLTETIEPLPVQRTRALANAATLAILANERS